MNGRKLDGKVALVTGGSRDVGAAIALALADEGADVAISYVFSADKARAVADQVAAKGVRAAAFRADQGDASQSESLIREVIGGFGHLDILVNNAAIALQGKAIDDPTADTAALDRMWSTNVHGVVANIRAAVKVLPEGGRIITIGSGVNTGWISYRRRLCRNKGGHRPILQGSGTRSWRAQHHRQCRAGGSDGY